MNNIVSLDTSTEACSVALRCGTETQFRYCVEQRAHARVLLPMLDELMADAGLSPTQLDGVTFTRGPGAFTGVRIATAAAQAIALGADLPVAPVSTLATIAKRAHREHGLDKIAVAIDARMAEVYWGAYQIQDELPTLVGAEKVCPPNQADQLDGSWSGVGTGWQTYPTELAGVTGTKANKTAEPFPHALDVLAIGYPVLQQGNGVAAEHALPVYLRDNVAKTEAERQGQQ